MNIINLLFEFVMDTCNKYNIDESHGLKHSIDVFNYASKLYLLELNTNPNLKDKKQIIFISAIIHDMCDHKYINESDGIRRIKLLLEPLIDIKSINSIILIITTMSHSKVKINGFPNLGDDQLAYNIVREADLLTAYDFDRSIVYAMNNKNLSYLDAFIETEEYFNKRVLTQIDSGLFLTAYGLEEAKKLHANIITFINIKKYFK
jgi:hypothetical protein